MSKIVQVALRSFGMFVPTYSYFFMRFEGFGTHMAWDVGFCCLLWLAFIGFNAAFVYAKDGQSSRFDGRYRD